MLTHDSADDIASSLDLANSNAANARANPENYVFFIAHMYHMLATDHGNNLWSIPTNWDFSLKGRGANRIYGAIETEQTEEE